MPVLRALHVVPRSSTRPFAPAPISSSAISCFPGEGVNVSRARAEIQLAHERVAEQERETTESTENSSH